MSKIELLKPSPMSTSLYFDEKVVSVEGDGKTGTTKEGGREGGREEGKVVTDAEITGKSILQGECFIT